MSFPLLKGGPINNWNTLWHKQSTITGITAEKHIFKWCSFYLSSCASVLHHFLKDKHNKMARFQNTWPLNIYSTAQKQFGTLSARDSKLDSCVSKRERIEFWDARIKLRVSRNLNFSIVNTWKGFKKTIYFSRKITIAIPVYSKNSNQPSGLDMHMSRVSFLGDKKGPMEGFLILNFG